MQDINVTTFCINPCFSMSPTVLATPLSGTQLMLMECKLLTWQQMRSSLGSQTFQMGLQLCPYPWPNDCLRVQWQWTWPSSTLYPPTGVTTWGTLSLRWWCGGHQLCLVSWIWLDLIRSCMTYSIQPVHGLYMCIHVYMYECSCHLWMSEVACSVFSSCVYINFIHIQGTFIRDTCVSIQSGV